MRGRVKMSFLSRRFRVVPFVIAVFAAVMVSACGSAPNEPDMSPVATGALMPDRASFPEVADALQPSCGTLDCHGSKARNMRLYGGRGMRLDPKGNSADDPTTDDEYEATFRSIVYFEPNELGMVLQDRGLDPNRLTMIRKARGLERHKGGMQMLRGDPLDRCITSWLASQTDVDACRAVSRAERPGLVE